jgi:hypothetical protein
VPPYQYNQQQSARSTSPSENSIRLPPLKHILETIHPTYTTESAFTQVEPHYSVSEAARSSLPPLFHRWRSTPYGRHGGDS